MPQEENKTQTAWDAVKAEICVATITSALASWMATMIVLMPKNPILELMQYPVCFLTAGSSLVCILGARAKLRSITTLSPK